MPIDGCRVIIQGFGNVGSNAARLMMEHGYKIIGIAEKEGGLSNPNGIDIHQLVEYKFRNVVSGCVSKANIDKLVALVARLDTMTNTNELTALMGQPVSTP